METVVELRLRQPRPLEYVFRLRFNEYDDALLKRSVRPDDFAGNSEKA